MRVYNSTRKVDIGDRIGKATTSAARRQGLLKHERLEHGEGLWIAPCEAVHTFFMKFPIDVVFLSRRRQVVKISAAVPKRRMALCLRAHSVLELPAGTAERTGLAVGDQLEFEDSATA